MDNGAAAELRALRLRAYGPDADIDADPAARARLGELEAAERAERMPLVAAGAPASAFTDATPRPLPPPAVDAAGAARSLDARHGAPRTTVTSTTTTAPAPDARRRRFVLALTWAGSLALVATVAVALTAAFSARTALLGPATADDAGIRHVTTLALDPDSDVADELGMGGFGGEPPVTYEPYLGFTPISGAWGPPGDQQTCVTLVSVPEDPGPDEPGIEWSFSGCGAGPFAASLQFTVETSSPEAVKAAHPVGTALQFVLQGETVEVFAADPPAVEAGGRQR